MRSRVAATKLSSIGAVFDCHPCSVPRQCLVISIAAHLSPDNHAFIGKGRTSGALISRAQMTRLRFFVLSTRRMNAGSMLVSTKSLPRRKDTAVAEHAVTFGPTIHVPPLSLYIPPPRKLRCSDALCRHDRCSVSA